MLLRWSYAPVLLVLAAPFAAAAAPRNDINLRPQVYRDFVAATAQPRDEQEVAQIWQTAEHVLEPHDPIVSAHSLVLTSAAVARLRQTGIAVTVEAANVQQMVDDSYARNDQPLYDATATLGPFFAKVQPNDAIEAHLKDLVAKSAGRARLSSLGKSIEGRDIHALLISSNPDDATRASIIVTGTHHPREWLSPMVTVGIADALINRYDLDPQVRAVVDHLHVYVVPVVNPDGYVRTFNGNRLQRKNLRAGCNVDINRNYATAFGQRVSNNCNAETTSGPMAFSEPETRAIKQLAEQQKNLRLYVDYHSGANQVMIPYAFTEAAPPGFEKNRAWGNLLAAQVKLPARPAYALARGQGGGALDWFREKYSDSLVVELPARNFDPPPNGVAANVELQWAGWLAVAVLVARENVAPGAAVPDGGPDAGPDADAAGGGNTGGMSGSGLMDAAAGGGGASAGGATGQGGMGGGGGVSSPSGGTAGVAAPAPLVDPGGNEVSGWACQVARGAGGSFFPLLFAAVALGRALRRRTRS